MKIEDDTSLIMVRQTFLNRQTETPCEVHIENLNGRRFRIIFLRARVEEGLRMASMFVAGAPLLFARWAKGFQKHTNQLPQFDPEVSNAAGGDADIIYYHSYWKLKDKRSPAHYRHAPGMRYLEFSTKQLLDGVPRLQVLHSLLQQRQCHL